MLDLYLKQATDSCAKAIVELFQNPQLCLKLSNLGYRYVMEQGHNWEEESAPCLIEAYDQLCGLN